MIRLDAIQLLTDLITQQSEEASLRLGRAISALDAARQKLVLLEDYHKSYADQLQLRLSEGLNVSSYYNFQAFMLTLANAINQQQQQVQKCQHVVDVERKAWQEHERKRLSYDVLHQQAKTELKNQANKREQKETDEYAARNRLLKS